MGRRPSQHVDSPEAAGKRIRDAREQAGLTQRELSFDGCTPAYISRIEAGARIPSYQILRAFGDKLGVSAEFLATGNDDGDLSASDGFLEAELATHAGDIAGARAFYEQARSSSSARIAARAELGLARLALAAGDHNEAVPHLVSALGSGELSATDTTEAQAGLGRAYALMARYEEAIGLLEGALAHAEAIDDEPNVLRFSVLLANTYIDRGNFGHAEELLARILERARASSEPVTLSHLYWSQSRLHSSQSRFDLASHYARLAHATLAATEHTNLAARALGLLAFLENERGNYSAALDLIEECSPIMVAGGNRIDEGRLMLDRARALAALGRREEAASIALGATSKFEGGSPMNAGHGYAIAAGIFLDLGDREKALELYELAAETLPAADRHLVDVYRALARIHEDSGDFVETNRFLKLALDVQATPVRR
jgi:tetratricopeptide (TPR) repeat protein